MCRSSPWSSSLPASLPEPAFQGEDRLLLASDLHLSDETPALTDWALDWLRQACLGHGVRHLWLLGDLFDAWVGDDQVQQSPCAQAVAQTLRGLSEQGIQVGLMRGNRDFLLGQDFAQACGAESLPDEWAGPLPDGIQTLVCHGDALCLDDTDYMQFRNMTRQAGWQSAFLGQTLAVRLAAAQQLRAESESAKSGKSMAIMDIRPSAAQDLLRSLGCERLIHGHTHRPGQSPLGERALRWVLPDWAPATPEQPARGGGLLVHSGGVEVLGASAP